MPSAVTPYNRCTSDAVKRLLAIIRSQYGAKERSTVFSRGRIIFARTLFHHGFSALIQAMEWMKALGSWQTQASLTIGCRRLYNHPHQLAGKTWGTMTSGFQTAIARLIRLCQRGKSNQ
jgi:hypothetical protein